MFFNPIDQLRDHELAKRGLPQLAYIDNSKRIYGNSPLVAVKRGEQGFYPIEALLSADQLSAFEGVTDAQREAMLTGSMFGWHVSGADPVVQEKLLGRAGSPSIGGERGER
jgi:hypothetical protein